MRQKLPLSLFRLKNLLPRQGVTLIELLVAIAITGIFLTGVMEGFVYILRTSEDAEAELEAVTNARAALETMSMEIKAARIDPRRPIQFFRGLSQDAAYGDGVDNDLDGRIDEEIHNGRDDDGDYASSEDDLHANFGGGLFERKDLVKLPDLGDSHIDEDCRFAGDILEFITFPDPNNPGYREKTIRYSISIFDGQPSVLVRHVVYNPHDPDSRYEEDDPIAFNVLSLSFLYWDPNRIPMNWVTSWDSLYAPMFPDPQIELPVAVHISITVYSGTEPFREYRAGQKVETTTLETVVNIEQVLKDERYQNFK
jgi:prepilin-type N-terminal cleavage/methylation domain-containing protein